jgi:vitamin B12 transporter
MSRSSFDSRRFCARLLTSTLCLPMISWGPTAARAQQAASPDLLPPIVISLPKRNAGAAQSLAPVRQAQRSRRTVRAPAQPPTAAGTPNTVSPVVVSPTSVVTPSGQAASSVTVVTGQDIQTQQYRSVPDVLNTVPGLNVVQTGGPGGQTSVFMRGTNSNHTKVLVDGIDVSDPSTPNGAFDFAHLLAADIQQLEVLRGPQSGLYGSDAIGGIISMVTQKGDGSPRATASIETGSFKTFNQTAGLGGSQDNFNYALNVAHLHAGDIPVTLLELMPPGQKANANNYDNMTYSTKFGADINECWSVNSVVHYTDATLLFTGDSGFPSTPIPVQSTHAVQQFFTREEAVSSLLDGRIKNYFAVNYANNRSSDIAPGDRVATVTTGQRTKYDWHSVTELRAETTSLSAPSSKPTEWIRPVSRPRTATRPDSLNYSPSSPSVSSWSRTSAMISTTSSVSTRPIRSHQP